MKKTHVCLQWREEAKCFHFYLNLHHLYNQPANLRLTEIVSVAPTYTIKWLWISSLKFSESEKISAKCSLTLLIKWAKVKKASQHYAIKWQIIPWSNKQFALLPTTTEKPQLQPIVAEALPPKMSINNGIKCVIQYCLWQTMRSKYLTCLWSAWSGFLGVQWGHFKAKFSF